MNDVDLCKWLRDNSSGAYRNSALAADRIEELLELTNEDHLEWLTSYQLKPGMNVILHNGESDHPYQSITEDNIRFWRGNEWFEDAMFEVIKDPKNDIVRCDDSLAETAKAFLDAHNSDYQRIIDQYLKYTRESLNCWFLRVSSESNCCEMFIQDIYSYSGNPVTFIFKKNY